MSDHRPPPPVGPPAARPPLGPPSPGAPPPPPPGASPGASPGSSASVRPGRGRRRPLLALAGVVIAVVGVVVAGALAVVGGARLDDAIDGLARAPVGCETVLDFDGTGSVTLYVETAGAIDSVPGDCDVDGGFDARAGDPDVELALVAPDGTDLTDDLREAVDDSSYDSSIDGVRHVGASRWRIDIDEPGDHVLTVSSSTDEVFAVAVGREPDGVFRPYVVGSVVTGALSIVAGLALLGIGLRRRPLAQDRRDVAAAAPAGATWLGGPAPTGPPGAAPFGPSSAPGAPGPPPPSRPGTAPGPMPPGAPPPPSGRPWVAPPGWQPPPPSPAPPSPPPATAPPSGADRWGPSPSGDRVPGEVGWVSPGAPDRPPPPRDEPDRGGERDDAPTDDRHDGARDGGARVDGHRDAAAERTPGGGARGYEPPS